MGDLVPASWKLRETLTWWNNVVADNGRAEQLQRAEKARYTGEIRRKAPANTAACQKTLYATWLSSSTRDAMRRLRWREVVKSRVQAVPMCSSMMDSQSRVIKVDISLSR